MHDLLEGGDLRLRILGIEAMEDDLDMLLGLEDVEDQGREREELADTLHGFDREARCSDLGKLEAVFETHQLPLP